MPVYLALPNFLETNGAAGIVCPVFQLEIAYGILVEPRIDSTYHKYYDDGECYADVCAASARGG